MGTKITSLDEYKKFLLGRADDIGRIGAVSLGLYDTLTKELNLPPTGDVRNAYFAHISNHCNNVRLMLLTVSDCLANPRWLAQRVQRGSIQDLEILIGDLDNSMRQTAFLGAWAYTENAIRRIRTVITKSPATGNIYSQCKNLYQIDLKHLKAVEFLELIKLVTRTRNTSHNNLSYYPDRGGDEVLVYKGKYFEFTVGQKLNFFNWSFIHERISNLLDLYKETVREPRIATIKQISSH